MSTNGIIARSTGEGTFAGRYHHWDSYPSGLGTTLVELYRGHFNRDLDRMLQVLGWAGGVLFDVGENNKSPRIEAYSFARLYALHLNYWSSSSSFVLTPAA
jgi:hypothetical protein